MFYCQLYLVYWWTWCFIIIFVRHTHDLYFGSNFNLFCSKLLYLKWLYLNLWVVCWQIFFYVVWFPKMLNSKTWTFLFFFLYRHLYVKLFPTRIQQWWLFLHNNNFRQTGARGSLCWLAAIVSYCSWHISFHDRFNQV